MEIGPPDGKTKLKELDMAVQLLSMAWTEISSYF